MGITEAQYRIMKELYKRYKSVTPIYRLLNINKAIIRYWLGLNKKKPKFKYMKRHKNLTRIYNYTNFILNEDYETIDPVYLGRQLRDNYIELYGVEPEMDIDSFI